MEITPSGAKVYMAGKPIANQVFIAWASSLPVLFMLARNLSPS